MFSLAIVSKHYKQYAALFASNSFLSHHFSLIYAGTSPNPIVMTQAHVVLGDPSCNAEHILCYQKMDWFQSTWAGNNVLSNTATKNYVLTGVKGIFAEQMREYVMAYLLYFSRNISGFIQHQQQRSFTAPPYYSLSNKTIAILGFGNIGQAVGSMAQSFGMQVLALSRSSAMADVNSVTNGKSAEIFARKPIQHYQPQQLHQLLSQSDFVVNLLPETPSTIGLCDETFFANIKVGSVFINAGRGSVLKNEKVLLESLHNKRLSAAVLDVFEQEPLPTSSALYNDERIFITCHTAAESVPAKVFEVFVENATRYINNQALQYVHDFEQGY